MKQKIKNIFKILFGTNSDILLKINFSSLITGIIFFILAVGTPENNPNSAEIFTYIAGICFAIWINIIQEFDSASKFMTEFSRLTIFFIIFIFSAYNCLTFSSNYDSNSIVKVAFSSVGLFLCSFYFVSKLMSIFNFIKKMFRNIKIKLFNSDNPANSKTKALIENITAFFVSIGGLTVAIKVIAESIFQVFDYFK